jgi:imidazolonepropionase-like amidohydrolase
MSHRGLPLWFAVCVLCLSAFAIAQQSAAVSVIKAGTLIDGRGGVTRNATIVVEGSRIARINTAAGARPTCDFSNLTVLPGLIDTQSHIATHFGKDGRASTAGETATEEMLYAHAPEAMMNAVRGGC